MVQIESVTGLTASCLNVANVSTSILRSFASSTLFESCKLSVVADLSGGSTASVDLSNVAITSNDPGQATIQDGFVRPAGTATAGAASFGIALSTFSTNFTVTLSTSSSVSVSSLSIDLPATLEDEVDTTFLVPVDVTLSDSSATSLVTGFVPASLLSYSISGDTNGLTISSDGIITITGSSAALSTLTVSKDSVIASDSFAVNPDPAVNDVDIGQRGGMPFSAATAGSQFNVGIRVNAGTSQLKRVEMRFVFTNVIAQAVQRTAATINGALTASGSTSGVTTITADINGTFTGVVDVAGITLLAANAASGSVTTAILRLETESGVVIDTATASKSATFTFAINSVSTRRRRAVARAPCASPPCEVCVDGAHQTGDINADCIFDFQDVDYFLNVMAQAPDNPTALTSLLPVQQAQLDVDGDGVVDLADGEYLFRVLSKRINFVDRLSIQTVDVASGCRLDIEVRLIARGDFAASNASLVYFDLEPLVPGISSLLTSSTLDEGVIVPFSKGNNFNGVIWQAISRGNGTFGIRLHTELNVAADIGVSFIHATIPPVTPTSSPPVGAIIGIGGNGGTTGGSSDVKIESSEGMLGRVAFAAGHTQVTNTIATPLNISLTIAGSPISIRRESGYTPRATFNNSQRSATCHASSVCPAGTFEQAGHTSTSSKICTPLTQCNFATQYQSSAPTATSDRTCTALTTCVGDEVETQAPTNTSDRVCDEPFIGACGSNPCQGNSLCTNVGTDDFRCTCEDGRAGKTCAFVDQCVDGATFCNGATCEMDDLGNARCVGDQCGRNFFGDFCPCCEQGSFTCQPGVCKTPQAAQSSAGQDTQSSVSDSNQLVIGLVLGGLLLLVLVVFGYISHSKRKNQDLQYSDETTSLLMTNPVYTSDSGINMYVGSYRRANSFHYQRYVRQGRPVIGVGDATLGLVYDVLQVPRPPLRLLQALNGKLTTQMNTIIHRTAALEDDRSNQVESVIDFIRIGIVDATFEDIVDLYLEELLSASTAQTGLAAPAVPERSVQVDFLGLRETHWAPYVDPIDGRVSDVEYEDVRTVFNGDYAKRRTLSIRGTKEQAYSYAFEVDDDPLYDAAVGTDAVYDNSSSASKRLSGMPENVSVDPYYDLSDPLRETGFDEPALQVNANYDFAAPEATEAKYEFANTSSPQDEDSYALAGHGDVDRRYSRASDLRDDDYNDDDYDSGPDYENANLAEVDEDDEPYSNVDGVAPEDKRKGYLQVMDASNPLGLQRDSIKFRSKPSNSDI
eukprot:TRINITY_DN12469_c0_g2_i7.p1 TRINITY_DN12469_c0_g2~~TRINITY_DN12469_c0_g2_i7.p1  ORF type:complete len:1348 (+),score=259.66 TRINITY_DN12469_c0_g2_i7:278-4045(+)